MRYLLICLLLSGCASIFPSSLKFPEAPELLLQKCPALGKLEEGAKLSEVAKSVSNNYTLYHDCSDKNDAWNDWYQRQKKIYEDN